MGGTRQICRYLLGGIDGSGEERHQFGDFLILRHALVVVARLLLDLVRRWSFCLQLVK